MNSHRLIEASDQSEKEAKAIEILEDWKGRLDQLRHVGIDPSCGDGYWKIRWEDLNTIVEVFSIKKRENK